jgi:SAM-dependent MidA family methyltransferase
MQYTQPASLPKPDDISATHSARVAEYLREKITTAGGKISFAEFMQDALYAPGLGYYSAGATKFGGAGDFITAPEVSSVFGRVLARQCAEVLSGIKDGAVLEAGAGSGKLALDMLTAFEEMDALPSTYNILEVSADLADRQQRQLQDRFPHLVGRIRWLSELPENFDGVIVANEVVDALPVERFVKRKAEVVQLCVSVGDGGFVWSEAQAPYQLSEFVAGIEADLGRTLEEGYVSEVSLASPQWVADLARSLRHGVMFLFDYGVSRREYYAPDRTDGWLRCHYRHHAHNNPLIYPGIQDLTAWVDFSSLAGSAVKNGLEILGYQTQSQFLMGGGLTIEMAGFYELPIAEQLALSGQIKTLTLPGEMGENFKCIALGRGAISVPSAFQFADRTETL